MIALRGRRSFMAQGRHGIDPRRPPRRNATRHKRREQQDHHCKAQRPRIGGDIFNPAQAIRLSDVIANAQRIAQLYIRLPPRFRWAEAARQIVVNLVGEMRLKFLGKVNVFFRSSENSFEIHRFPFVSFVVDAFYPLSPKMRPIAATTDRQRSVSDVSCFLPAAVSL